MKNYSIFLILLLTISLSVIHALSNPVVVTPLENSDSDAIALALKNEIVDVVDTSVTHLEVVTQRFSGVSTGDFFPAVPNTFKSSQVGTFTGGLDAQLGIDSGIVLSTGRSQTAGVSDALSNAQNGSNLGVVTSPKDTDLQNVIGAPPSQQDSVFLELDFKINNLEEGATATVFFNYVWASDEYFLNTTEDFNDGFGFFVDGQNVALLPNNAAVSIQNVNESANNALFRDNETTVSSGTEDVGISFSGLTQVLRAEFDITNNVGVDDEGVDVGTKTIKIALTDAIDGSFDSAVFIQGGTFSVTPPASLGVSDTDFDFGDIRLGTSGGSQALTITNTGGKLLTGNYIGTSENGFNSSNAGINLNAGGNLNRNISFNGNTVGQQTSSVQVNTDAGSQLVTLEANVVTPIFQTVVDSNTLENGDTVDFGSADETKTFNITNDIVADIQDLTDLTILNVILSGSNSFTLDQDILNGTVLTASDLEQLIVSFDESTNSGQQNATLRVFTDQGAALGASGTTFTYTLTGTGFTPLEDPESNEGGSAVPEPNTIALMVIALGAFFGRRKRSL